MKVLFVASEAVPFVKSGGLGDVIGSLPNALKEQSMDIRVIIPKYKCMPAAYNNEIKKIGETYVAVGWRSQYCGIEMLQLEGINFYLIDNEYYFKRPQLYTYFDEAERYAFFCRGVLECLPYIDFQPDIIHCHDWHTGMVSVFLNAHYRHIPFYKDIKTVFTIHNLKYQGIFSKDILEDILGLDHSYFTSEGIEFNDAVNFMKGGLIYSDKITTVSQTYAEEIQTPYYGEQMDGLLRHRNNDLIGILNGIDYNRYDPKTDTNIISYNRRNIKTKAENKIKLQRDLNLNIDGEKPMISMVTRLVGQKGLDLVCCVFEEIMALDLQFVLLGTGDKDYEDFFRQAALKYAGRVSTSICFDDKLAVKIYAASDLFLMPSLYEPCGLGQMIALRYGTLPIVRETGGLKDTVEPYNEFTEGGNGFSFTNYNAHDMLYTIEYSLGVYNKKTQWNKLVRNAMKCDFSWNNSAIHYMELYKGLLANKGGYHEPFGEF